MRHLTAFRFAGWFLLVAGIVYLVLGVARHSETEEELVVYRLLYGDYGLWVRPRTMFLEEVEVDSRRTPRFAYLGPA